MKVQSARQPILSNPVLRSAAALFLAAQLLTGCALFRGVTHYDPISYKNLTDLKPRVGYLYDSFTGETLNQPEIDQVRLGFAQMVEYEKGKGPKNETTVDQAVSLENLFEKHIKDRKDRGVWSAEHCENQKGLISEAFDIAISTEQLKNK